MSDWATIGWLSLRSAFAFAIIAWTSAAETIVREAAAGAAGAPGCWALAAKENTTTPTIDTRMASPPKFFSTDAGAAGDARRVFSIRHDADRAAIDKTATRAT